MSQSASITFNCGKASYEYTKPEEPEEPSEPTMGPMTCHGQKTCRSDVSPDRAKGTARRFCKALSGRKLSAKDWGVRSPVLLDDHWIDDSPADRAMEWYYQYWAFWVKDDNGNWCDVESERDIGGEDCYENFYSAYRDCNNGGNGGYHQIGCVIMGFEPVCEDLPGPGFSGPGSGKII